MFSYFNLVEFQNIIILKYYDLYNKYRFEASREKTTLSPIENGLFSDTNWPQCTFVLVRRKMRIIIFLQCACL